MIFSYVGKIKNNDHYFSKNSVSYDNYLSGLDSVINNLSVEIGNHKIADIILKKLQFGSGSFNENQYIQAACELTVMGDFLGNKDLIFKYEDKITPPKDVDFSIYLNGRKYNIEVKCPSYFHDDLLGDEEVVVKFTNRAPSKEDLNTILGGLKSALPKKIKVSKNLDNVMKDFLESAQEKMIDSPLSNVNVLVVCCNDEVDLKNWRDYLIGNGGFFTDDSYIGRDSFDRVDFVLLTNVYNRHFRYFEDSRLSNHWSIRSSFNLLYANSKSKLSWTLRPDQGQVIAKDLCNMFPNFSSDFERYMSDDNDFPEGENVINKGILGILWYLDRSGLSGRNYFKKLLNNK